VLLIKRREFFVFHVLRLNHFEQSIAGIGKGRLGLLFPLPQFVFILGRRHIIDNQESLPALHTSAACQYQNIEVGSVRMQRQPAAVRACELDSE